MSSFIHRPIALVAVLAACLAFTGLGTAPPLRAELCQLDDRPGATLLLPYFEVDLEDEQGVTTILSVNNISPETVLARAVLWTNAGIPTFGFEIYLTGYDVQSVNLRDVLNGELPTTGPGTSPLGSISESPGPFPSCTFEPPAIPFDAFLQAAHTGRPSPRLEGLCAGIAQGDDIARGYLTVDVVEDCTPFLPTDAAYFATDGPLAHANVLWGDYFFLEEGSSNARGGRLVALEADPEAFDKDDLTFYRRFSTGGVDAREPLPTVWGNRFVSGGGFEIASSSIVWRDPGVATTPFACAGTPFGLPEDRTVILTFDEQENPSLTPASSSFAPFPLVTQQVVPSRPVGFGWEMMDLAAGTNPRRQSYVLEVLEAQGRYSLIRPAMPLDGGCEPGFALPEPPPPPPPPPPTLDGAIFVVNSCPEAGGGENFRLHLTEPDDIAEAERLLATGETLIPNGRLRRGNGGFNAPWSWHLDPADFEWAFATIEVCSGCASFVEENRDHWVDVLRRYCPWSAVVIGREQ